MTGVHEEPDTSSRGTIRCRECLITSLVSTIICSITFFIIFWCTNFLSNVISSNLVITENSMMFEWFVRPPISAAYNIRIFNYTNIPEFTRGEDKKLKVKEVGPYIYRETLTRVNTEFYPNGTLSFQEKSSFQWQGGRPDDDVVVVPNIPLLTTMAFARDMSIVSQWGLTLAISAFPTQTFLPVSVGGFLWGYDDKLFDAAKPFMSFLGGVPMDRFGVLVMKNGLSRDVITIYTGEGDLSKMGMIERVNGRTHLNIWGDDSCDSVFSSAGFLYPPNMYQDPSKTLDTYTADMCRMFKFDRVGEGSSYGIPTISFQPPADTFTFTSEKEHCFCPKKPQSSINGTDRVCPPIGIFNVSACALGTPMLSSSPHFYGGQPSLFSNIEGLKPEAELHLTHLEIHPRLGLPIGGHKRLQMNVEARKASGVPFLGNLEDGQILPILWIDMEIDSIPEDVLSQLKNVDFTIGLVESVFQWGSIIAFLFSTSALLLLLRRIKKRHRILEANKSGQEKLLQESS